MGDLEKDALRRDHKFLVRLVLVLILGTLVSVFIFAHLTSDRSTGCAVDAFEGVTGGPPSE